MTDRFDAKIKRSAESWAYFYTILGFALTIEAAIIGMMTPFVFPLNIIVFLLVASLTAWWFIESEWLHNQLIAIKNHYENKFR